jgi:hypothetical protein
MALILPHVVSDTRGKLGKTVKYGIPPNFTVKMQRNSAEFRVFHKKIPSSAGSQKTTSVDTQGTIKCYLRVPLVHEENIPNVEKAGLGQNAHKSLRDILSNLHKPWKSSQINIKICQLQFNRTRIFLLLSSPRIYSKESILPSYVAWRASSTALFLLGS